MKYFIVKTRIVVTETWRVLAESKEQALENALQGRDSNYLDGDTTSLPEATIEDVTEDTQEERE